MSVVLQHKRVDIMPVGQEMHNLIEFCKVMASSQFYQKLGPGGVMAIYLTAKELNLPFMTCLNGGLYSIDGKVTMSAQMINMMIVNSGHRVDVITLDETQCHLRFVRCDRKKGEGDTFDYTYTIEQARKAGYLTKDNWKYSPKDMVYSRCLSGGGRKFMPDVFMNVLVHGELVGSDKDGNIDPLVPIEISTNIEPQENDHPRQLKDGYDDKNKESEVQSPASESSNVNDVIAPEDGYQEFLKKHNDKMAYLDHISDKTKKSVISIVNYSIKNEEAFVKAFEKWNKQKLTV